MIGLSLSQENICLMKLTTFLLCSSLCPLGLAHNRCSINFCHMNQWMNEWTFYVLLFKRVCPYITLESSFVGLFYFVLFFSYTLWNTQSCKDLVLIYLKQLFATAQMSWNRMRYAYHSQEGLSSFYLLSLCSRLLYQLHNCHTR